MDINLDIEYTGKCEMAIDADVVSNLRSVVVVVVVVMVAPFCHHRFLIKQRMLQWK